jgi:hypothetical protein
MWDPRNQVLYNQPATTPAVQELDNHLVALCNSLKESLPQHDSYLFMGPLDNLITRSIRANQQWVL